MITDSTFFSFFYSRLRSSLLGEAVGLDIIFPQLWLSMEHHGLININVSSHS